MPNISKLISCLLFALFSGLALQAQDVPSFDGEWRGYIRISDEVELRISIEIDDYSFVQYFRDDDGWRPVNPAESYYRQFQDIAVVGWVNSGGIWTENQMYSLSYVNNNKLKVIWTRHVTNRKDGEEGEAWSARGEGELIRID